MMPSESRYSEDVHSFVGYNDAYHKTAQEDPNRAAMVLFMSAEAKGPFVVGGLLRTPQQGSSTRFKRSKAPNAAGSALCAHPISKNSSIYILIRSLSLRLPPP